MFMQPMLQPMATGQPQQPDMGMPGPGAPGGFAGTLQSGVAPGAPPMPPTPSNPISPAFLPPAGTAPMGVAGDAPPSMAGGGGLGMVKAPAMTPTWQEKAEARSMTKGPILSSVPGRTDAHATHVPSGSYVIPADIVSGRGQGNTIAGASALQKLFKMGPYGSPAGAMPKAGRGLPRPPAMGKADGGDVQNDPSVGTPVRVNLAGGEVVVPPENLMDVVHPDLKYAHAIMDQWVLNERKVLRQTLAKLPGPAKD